VRTALNVEKGMDMLRDSKRALDAKR
jgi:hypothetical protein